MRPIETYFYKTPYGDYLQCSETVARNNAFKEVIMELRDPKSNELLDIKIIKPRQYDKWDFEGQDMVARDRAERSHNDDVRNGRQFD